MNSMAILYIYKRLKLIPPKGGGFRPRTLKINLKVFKPNKIINNENAYITIII